jgi:hypothetical protein
LSTRASGLAGLVYVYKIRSVISWLQIMNAVAAGPHVFSFIFPLDPSTIAITPITYHHISAQMFLFSGAVVSVSGSDRRGATASSDKQRRSTRPTTHISCTYCSPSPRIAVTSGGFYGQPLAEEWLRGYAQVIPASLRRLTRLFPRPMWTASCSPGSCLPIGRSMLACLG